MELLRNEMMRLDLDKLNRTALNDALYNVDIIIKIESNLEQKVHFHNLKIQLLNRFILLDKLEFSQKVKYT